MKRDRKTINFIVMMESDEMCWTSSPGEAPLDTGNTLCVNMIDSVQRNRVKTLENVSSFDKSGWKKEENNLVELDTSTLLSILIRPI